MNDTTHAGLCASQIARRYGSALCDLPKGHDGLHAQLRAGITWTTEQAVLSWIEDEA